MLLWLLLRLIPPFNSGGIQVGAEEVNLRRDIISFGVENEEEEAKAKGEERSKESAGIEAASTVDGVVS